MVVDPAVLRQDVEIERHRLSDGAVIKGSDYGLGIGVVPEAVGMMCDAVTIHAADKTIRSLHPGPKLGGRGGGE